MSETQHADYWYETCLSTRNELTRCEGDRGRLRTELAAALRERDRLLELLEEALSISAHGKGCPELREGGTCECWIARAREAPEKANG